MTLTGGNVKITKSEAEVIKAHTEVKRLWNLMCENDGVDPTSKFVVFSDRNPYTPDYNNAIEDLQDAIRAHAEAKARRASRRARHEALTSCGLTRVKVNGKVFYE